MTLKLVFLLLANSIFAQNLFDERIRKVTDKKTSIFLDRGIFHTGSNKNKSTLNKIRHRYSKKTKQERIVFDFKTDTIPRIYGHVSKGERKIYIDMFDTDLDTEFGTFGSSHFVKSIDFFPIQRKMLSAEVIFKENTTVDIFYLKGHGRFVIDVKR